MFFIKNKTKLYFETSFLEYPYSGIGNFLLTYLESSKGFENIKYINKAKVYSFFKLSIFNTLAAKNKGFRRFEDYFYRLILLQTYLLFQHKDYLIISPYHNLYLPYSKGKYIATVHDLVFIEKPEFFSGVTFMLNRFLLNWSINNSKAIITVSEDTRKKIQNNLNRKANVHIVYNCYPSIFYDYHFPELLKVDVPFVLYFGGSDPRKNLSLMFKIFEIYKDKAKGNLKLLCTKFREDYEIFLEDTQQLHRDIDFLGEISPEHLINKIIYSKAIFYLSDYEGFGRPVMEAAAFDKPIITKNLDVFKEITNANTLIVEDIDSGVNILKQLEKVSGLKSKYSISLNPKFLTSSNVLRFQNVVKQYIEINNGI